MDAPSPEMIKSVSDLLRTQITTGVIIVLVLGAALFLFNKWLEYRKNDKKEAAEIAREQAREEADAKREATRKHEHKEMLGALTQLVQVTNERAIREEKSFEQLVDMTNETRGIVSGMYKVVGDLLAREAGAINRDDSLRLVERFFMFDVRVDVIAVFKKAMEANGFAERAQFIESRVKTSITQILETTEKSLRNFNLSIAVDPFFARGKSTYHLTDTLWEQVKPLFTHRAALPDRLEEMHITVQSKIREHVQSGFEHIHDVYRGDAKQGYTRTRTDPEIILPPGGLEAYARQQRRT